jgi:pimeloyl-ACP methyl ester carboxylesterase
MNSNQPADLKNGNEKIFVLVHGAGQGARAFEKVAWPLTRDGHHVIARDLPGHGLRARYAQSYLERPADPDFFAARQGVDIATYLKGLGPALTPEQAGKAIVDLASGPGRDQDAYLLTAAGLSPVQH